MSTIYTFHAECSAIDSLASSDKFLVFDASTGRTLDCGPSDIATYVAASGGISQQLSGDVAYTGTASASFRIGSTLTSRVGFFGQTGTSAITTVTAAVTTLTAGACGVAFQTTASLSALIDKVNGTISALQTLGLMRT